jgi:ferredoxin
MTNDIPSNGFDQEISFELIKSLFQHTDWDVGYLDSESFKRCALSPIKETTYHNNQVVQNYTNNISFRGISNAIVLIRKGHTWDYSLYEEAISILENSGLRHWYIVKLNYKEAAIQSGLGVRARNALIYSYKFGFDCHILVIKFEQKIIDFPTNKRKNYKLWTRCRGCDDCLVACPPKAIHNEGENPLSYWVDSIKCNEFLQYSDHPNIPSIKDFWSKYVHPEIPKSVIDKMTDTISTAEQLSAYGYGTDMLYDANGYTYDGQAVKKDGIKVDVPVCRECTSQPRCSKWGGNYPYNKMKENIIVFHKSLKTI